MRSILARRAKTVADEALYRASSAGSSVTVSGGFQNTLYVTPSGNDTTGDGTFFKPFATIARANTKALTVATESTPYVVILGIGQYTENVAIVPYVTYITSGTQDDFNVVINGNLTLDPTWGTIAGYPDSGVEGVAVNGTTTLDFVAVGNTQGAVIFFNVDFNDTFAANGNNNLQGVLFELCSLLDAESTTLTGVACESIGSNYGDLSIVSTAIASAQLLSQGDQMGVPFGSLNTFTIDASAGMEAGFVGVVAGVASNVTLKGANASYTSGVSSIGQSVTLLDGAPAPVILGSGSAPVGSLLVATGTGNWTFNATGNYGYTPAVSGNWVGPAPTTVKEALDRIAANTGNAHPIP
jgi:hypothetical protein